MAYHRYTVHDVNQPAESLGVYWRLSFFASPIAMVIGYALHAIADSSPWLSISSVPVSTPIVYILLGNLTSSHLWRCSVARRLLGITTPNINGVWQAGVDKSLAGEQQSQTGTFSIEQTWRTISIVLSTAESTSRSTSAALIVDAGVVRLEHQYFATRINRPGSDFKCHQGAAFVDFPLDNCDKADHLTLSYFTETGEFGVVTLIRKPDTIQPDCMLRFCRLLRNEYERFFRKP
ncbi:Cap15 family cyclic dinucleotide receptor domain-containing protein [Methylomonas rhizoryzae]|uniref:Cap15 family cyclic dinucleotide receptor domain-containing protein n=1 Tax=Methylomonas rhizoryzae TaxID=2608981 RepID=UPI001231CE0F|nr:hypothetical protein [Methylomonas rhizoryzae]